MKGKVFLLLILLFFGSYFYFGEGLTIGEYVHGITGSVAKESSSTFEGETLTIAAWNLQIFGQSKASNYTLLNYYVNKIDDYDIVFIQEIRDKEGKAFDSLCRLLQPDYDCMISTRAGTTSSKEQYGLLYKSSLSFVEAVDYNPYLKKYFERPPLEVQFDLGYPLKIYTIHVKPDTVQKELENLEDLMKDDEYVMIIGDLNADCSYYNPDKEVEFDSWYWIIKDDEDTTVAKSDCAYDRIIVNEGMYSKIISYGIDDPVTKDKSDHYLVWVEIEKLNKNL